ncbi:MAG: DUF262 domain-containing HNH endonuclease family protein [Prevotella sp.]|nr:DUF262 domain-containing HNH endonuclease family protein [Prevotella sp.]
MINDNIQPLTIKELLSEDQYHIPVYQRNYDWSEKEARQLIEDIADYATIRKNKKYYIGSVVVFVRNKDGEEYFEIIDGQQRLTTFTIMMNVLRTIDEAKPLVAWYRRVNLSYDHRNEADEAIRMLADGKLSVHPSGVNLSEVYRIIQKNIRNILKDRGLVITDFVEYLLSKVIIMRIPVPKDTELNHYFEIMNSRGEQLEKHEVLKASLMDNLENDKAIMCLFNDIWEACSDMNTYVQMKMKPQMRKLIFSDSWADFQFDTNRFESLSISYRDMDNDTDESDGLDEYTSRTLADLFEDARSNVKYELPDSDKDAEGGNDRFGSVINFPNFLLQVLKVMYKNDNEYQKDIDSEIKLDDKRLIDIFQMVLHSCSDKSGFVKRYIVALLQMRYLFDCYVIKRESYNNKEGWSLKKLKKYDKSKVNYVGTFSDSDNEDDLSKDIRMLQAMFHVSAPTYTYKHWLNALLYYIYSVKKVEQIEMREKLYTLACTYMLDRYLCQIKTDFEEIIYINDFKANNNTLYWKMLDNGCNVENFIFNFYDYVTWKEKPTAYPRFEFTYRTSVEHFYPQKPMDGHPILDEHTGLHDFGNLCLISRGMNSKFSNNMPMAKYMNFGNEEVLKKLSIKLNEMMFIVKNNDGKWGIDEIREFEKKSRDRLYVAISKGCIKPLNQMDEDYAEESLTNIL